MKYSISLFIHDSTHEKKSINKRRKRRLEYSTCINEIKFFNKLETKAMHVFLQYSYRLKCNNSIYKSYILFGEYQK